MVELHWWPLIRLLLLLTTLTTTTAFIITPCHPRIRRWQSSDADTTVTPSLSGLNAANKKGIDRSNKEPKRQKKKKKKQSDREEEQKSSSIYSLPALYDLAFAYRNYDDEVDFLLSKHEQITGGKFPARRILEVAAGPARHSIAALTRKRNVQSVVCIDNSPEMRTYAQDLVKAEDEQLDVDDDNGSSLPSLRERFNYQLADMRDFQIDNEEVGFDTAWILLGSLQHMCTNQDVIDCFRCIHKALVSTGTLFVELPHPRETFSMAQCTRSGWKVPLDLSDDGITNGSSSSSAAELDIIWGDDDDEFDPITQIRKFTVEMRLSTTTTTAGDSDLQNIKQVVPMRLFTAQEIDALARLSGFCVVGMFGALEEGVNVDDEDESFRLVCALRKVPF